MCLLMVTLGRLPKREYLENAAANNPDGFGFAVHHGDRIVTGRSMESSGLIDRFYAEMSRSNHPIGMFHARFTTHGKTMLENNHPFRVDGRKDLVLAHNGMLPITPKAGDDRSDTRIFAENVLGAIGIEALDDKDTFRKLEQFASGSKVALLSTAPELRDSVYILNEHLGDWEHDIWWSNSGYKYDMSYSRYNTMYGGHYGGWSDESSVIGKRTWWEQAEADDDDYNDLDFTKPVDMTCLVCVQQLTEGSLMDGVCWSCNTCLDCYDSAGSCMCWSPDDTSNRRNVISSTDMVQYF
jgi:hypothetical protein